MGTTAGFTAVMFPAALIVATAYQWWAGAFGAEMASVFPDEGPHYINGLLIKRFLTEGLGQDPMAFAQSFYLHYPKVSIGHWPPLFYVIEALWMFIASESIQAEIFLSSLITAGLATLLGAVVWRRHGWAAGLIAGLAFVTLPVIRQITASLMVDVFIGLIVLAGTLLYIRYLDTGRCIWGVMFGLASSAAILSKGNGLELALLPPPSGAPHRAVLAATPTLVLAASRHRRRPVRSLDRLDLQGNRYRLHVQLGPGLLGPGRFQQCWLPAARDWAGGVGACSNWFRWRLARRLRGRAGVR